MKYGPRVARGNSGAGEPSAPQSSRVTCKMPGHSVAAERPGNLLLLGILQHLSATVNNSSRAFVQAPRWHVDQHPVANEGLHTQENQQWHNQGTGHVLWLHGTAEGHISASLGQTKCGLLDKGIANHFNILALRTP